MHTVSHRLALLAALVALPACVAPVDAAARTRSHSGVYDARQAEASRGHAASARVRSAQARLARRLGPAAVEQVDPQTGGLRALGNLDGALSGPSEDGPVTVAQRYLRDHAAALGLTAADIETFHLAHRTTTGGLTVLRWRQAIDGIPTFDSGLSVAVDRYGRVLTVTGSPAHDLGLADTTPSLSAGAALHVLQSTVGGDRPNGYHAALVDFAGGTDDRLAWQLDYQVPGGNLYHAVVDANTGRLLYRAAETDSASNASVFAYYPGAPAGGTVSTVDLSSGHASSWIGGSPTELSGGNAIVFSDLDDHDTEDAGESIPPSSGSDFNYAFPSFANPGNGACATFALCSWDHTSATSWRGTSDSTRKQNGTQVFYYVNTFHDHLAAPPIGFDAASGAFDGADRLIAQNDDGANTSGGGPDSDHRDNANMSTPPDGQSPTMQMYLFSHADASGAFRDVNGGDDAAIVYHEYTHGLSNRLVVDAGGAGALDSAQSGAMGEAWSDWYAMDFLNDQGYQPDTSAAGEVDLGAYTDATPNTIRSQPMDCPVGDNSSGKCPGGGTAGAGGYTYGDFGTICSCGPEVHADGEIWGETLWDLRTALSANLGSTSAGSQAAEALITGGMRLSPPEPTFLDERNAILTADTAGIAANGTSYGPGHFHDLIWNVFKARGMGFFASTLDGSDATPIEDFSSPPSVSAGTGTITGAVQDTASGLPRASVPVGLGGHATKSSFSDFLGGSTGGDGSFTVANVPVGTYPQFIVPPSDGYDRGVVTNVAVTSGGTTNVGTFSTRRDWAASGGGATATTTSQDYSAFGCGPSGAIDQEPSSGFSSDVTKSITIELPQAVNVASFEINPQAVCGDPDFAALGNFHVQTSPDGSAFTTAATGSFTSANDGQMNVVLPTAASSGVRYVRLFMDGHQSGGVSSFADIAEFAVYSRLANTLPFGTLSITPASVEAGQTLTFDASGITDPDSAIGSYHWDFTGDGTIDQTTSSATTTATVSAPGTYTGKVTVDDSVGGSFTASKSFTVTAPPAAATTTPTPTPTPTTTTPGGGGITSGGGGGGVTHAAPTITLFGTQPKGSRRIVVTCAVGCSGTARLVAGRSLAKSLGLKSTTFGSRSFQRAGSFSVTLTKAVLKALRRHHRHSVKLSLRVSAKDADGLTGSLTRTVTLRI